MKLELKHLAGYLPYGLKCTDGELIGIRNHIGWMGEFKSKYGSNHIPIQSIKPILRPLSDLTKEIDNGLTYNDLLRSDFDKNGINGFDFYYLQVTPLEYPFKIIQKLLEWHFDIYGLIENGLAIDINTLNK